jgi:hypothetical protein
MREPISPQIDSLIDLIVEAVMREIKDDDLKLKMANAALPTKEKRGVLETRHGNSKPSSD